jgi:hypothetical protein
MLRLAAFATAVAGAAAADPLRHPSQPDVNWFDGQALDATGHHDTTAVISHDDWTAQQEAAKAEAAVTAAMTQAEKAKDDANRAAIAAAEAEKAKKDLHAAKEKHNNPSPRQDIDGQGRPFEGPGFNQAGKATIKAPNGEHTATIIGDTSGLYCQDITARETHSNGALFLGTALNPMSDDFVTCPGTVDAATGVCCPASCKGVCDSTAATCDQRGGSLCCASETVKSERICSPLVAAPCIREAAHSRAIKVPTMYASAFSKATKVCFSPYGFYCEKVTKKINNPDNLALITDNNPADKAILIPTAESGQYEHLARVCLHPNILAPEHEYLQGTMYRHQGDFDSKVVSDWRNKYNLVHPGQTGYAYESAEKFNTWPAYKKFLPASGCCKVCDQSQPCGKSCIAKDATCSRDAGVHDWCACDKETAEKLDLLKKFPANIGKPDSWQGWPHTYPASYGTKESMKGTEYMAPHAAQTYKDFDTYKYGTTTNEFDKRGRFMPKLTANYSPSATKSCCRTQCAVEYASASTDSMSDCVEGCDLWISKSSLNWDGTKWLTKLADRCTRDCSNIHIWKTRRQVRGHKDGTDYYHGLRTPADETICAEGCSMFHQCVLSGGASPSTDMVKKVAVPLSATSDTPFCRKGWGILQDVDALSPDAPRACCHYSCGKCITNCAAEHGNNGLFKSKDEQSTVSARYNNCCVSHIVQSARFCDSHVAPCIVPPVSATSVSP